MILPDVNLLVYAHNDRAPAHEPARIWWEGLLNGTTPVGLPWVCIQGFLRIMTHPRVLMNPMEVSAAVSCVRIWLEQPPVRILHPSAKFAALFFQTIESLGVAGNLTTDAYLAALAVDTQADLHSADHDFARFPGLRWSNPLA